MWTSDSDAQKYLEKLFREKKVNCNMKPTTVQSKYPLFQEFSAAVFRKHWGLTKQMFDTNLASARNTPLDIDETSNMSGILEIDGHGSSYEPAEKKPKLEFGDTCKKHVARAVFSQAPVLPCVYTDPETKVEKCLVVVLLYHGVKKITCDLVESKEGPEPTLKITYHWPPLMYDVKSMFTKNGEQQMFTHKHHPKVMAVEKALQQFRENVEEAPLGYIEIKLPVDVQMDPNTWTQTFNKKADGTVIAFLEFTCKRDNYLIAQTEKTLTFD